ncbi:hypothetical protein HXX76_014588 [Chlamydomonas incerta]|uniref:Uncharacterized protein n=1 Tax=Chlamydomonas incerta TaxID=51695 RepID=A0A835VSZ5_CHLIN|nr:hypothetical protein HXX76_014588 [Chlamydomonas incerta]|eukprot:KAG2424379.1 hypothetical protein HXX76_014588 [Chlamydomonas incerta]
MKGTAGQRQSNQARAGPGGRTVSVVCNAKYSAPVRNQQSGSAAPQAAEFSGRGATTCGAFIPGVPLSGLAARPSSPTWRVVQHHKRDSVIANSTDYTSSASDEGVLRLPGRTELEPHLVTNVFGFPRNLVEKYHLGRVIGAGSFGVVREVVEKNTGKTAAVKTIPKVPKRGLPTPRYLLKLRTEVEIMQQLGYSLDAVNLRDVFEDDDSIHLVMELCEGGALLERIEAHKYSEKYIARLTRSILRFISQCHAKGIIYRDVKPDNFLFLRHDDESPLKATDFGLSIRHWPDEPKLTSRSGTPAYMAPELVLQSYDEKCDIWSVGMLTYQLLTGRFPFWEDVRTQTLSDVWKAILTTDINWDAQELKQLSPSAVDLLKRLLQRDPAQRPSAFAALEHPWLSEEGRARDLPLQGSVVQRLQRFSTFGHLKQLVLKMIVDEIRDEMTGAAATAGKAQAGVSRKARTALGNLQDLFNELDTDGSGAISFEELSSGLRRQGYVLADNEIENLMRRVDSDHNGTVDLSEFIATLLDWDQVQSDQNWQTYLDHAFRKMDHDGDGYISLDELLQQLPPLRPAPGAPSGGLAQVVGSAVSGAAAALGLGGRLDAYEGDAERLAEAKLMLREADTNGDGKISREEFFDLLRDGHAPDSLSFYDDRLSIGEDGRARPVTQAHPPQQPQQGGLQTAQR